MDNYFVLDISENGAYIFPHTRESLEEFLEELSEDDEVKGYSPEGDIMELGGGIWIFKGEFVRPIVRIIEKVSIP